MLLRTPRFNSFTACLKETGGAGMKETDEVTKQTPGLRGPDLAL